VTKTTHTPLSEAQRQEIFAALVAVQDAGAAVVESRHIVASKYDITVEQVREVERKGIDEEWPPL
jgi:hypothetical protein